jgi:hypothetical protein
MIKIDQDTKRKGGIKIELWAFAVFGRPFEDCLKL